MIGLIRRTWGIIRRPSVHYSLGFLTMGGFFMGVIFWGGFNTALEATNTEKFCISCHEMRENVFAELQDTVHYTNPSGVRATCPDCHVPHNWTSKIARKMAASKEVYGKIFGTISTPEKFEEHRLTMARHEWARMEANDSLECRNCHAAESMDITLQSPRAAEALRAHGCWFLFLPPCSPDLNPIEQAFSKIKHWMGIAQKRTPEDAWRHLGQLPRYSQPGADEFGWGGRRWRCLRRR